MDEIYDEKFNHPGQSSSSSSENNPFFSNIFHLLVSARINIEYLSTPVNILAYHTRNWDIKYPR
jgi:hypothetical protein